MFEKIIKEIIAAKTVSQKGDVAKHLLEQGFFKELPRGLERDKFLSGGNPVDVKEVFEKQQIKGD